MSELDRILAEFTSLTDRLTETVEDAEQAPVGVLRTHSKLMLVSNDRHVHDQLAVTGVTQTIGEDNLYRSDEWLGKGMRHAFKDAQAWVTQQTQ